MSDVPDAPAVDLTATQPFGDRRVVLNWTATGASHYDLLRDGELILSVTTVTSYLDEGPAAGQSTTWTVRAYSTDTCGVSLPAEDSLTIRGGADTDDGTGDWEPRLHFLRSR